MPTLELLSALSHDGGVQINLTDKICTVETMYPNFKIKGVGKTLYDATHDTIYWICNVLDDHPEDSVLLPNVLNALREMGLFSLTQTTT